MLVLFIFILKSVVVSSVVIFSEFVVLSVTVVDCTDSIFLYLFTSPATACLK